jgi:hypothetical protein
VKDSNGQKLAAVYYEEEPGRPSAAKPLTRDDARRIAQAAGVGAEGDIRAGSDVRFRG